MRWLGMWTGLCSLGSIGATQRSEKRRTDRPKKHGTMNRENDVREYKANRFHAERDDREFRFEQNEAIVRWMPPSGVILWRTRSAAQYAGHEKRAAVVRRALLAALMSSGRESLRQPRVQARGDEDLWAPRLALVHDAAILELFDECLFASARR